MLKWRATALWFAGRQAEGIEVARRAVALSEEVSGSEAIQCTLTLAMLLAAMETGPNPEAERAEEVQRRVDDLKARGGGFQG